MVQNSEVLAGEANRISLVCARQTAAQGDCLTITEREKPVNATEQTWTFEIREETRVGRTNPRLVNALVKIVNWLNHAGAGKIDDGHLESRHHIRQNFRAKGIGL